MMADNTNQEDRKRDKMGQDETLSPKQLQAIEALMMGSTITEAAAKAGVDRRTLHRWLGKDPFRKTLRLAQEQSLAEQARAIGKLTDTALATLKEVLTDPTAPSSVRVRAALSLLSHRRDFYKLDAATEYGRVDKERPSMLRWIRRPE